MHHQLTQPIDTVIFDLGNVLIKWDPRNLYRKVFVDPGAMEYFLSEICTPEWNLQQDAGRTWAEAIEERIEKFPAYESEIRAFFDRWEEMLGGAIEESVYLLKSLHQSGDYKLLALTNWSAETWPIAWEQFEFLQLFEGIVVSGQEKLAKPDEAIYQLICDRYHVEPSRALFIDDSSANVIGAQKFGLNAIQFESANQFKHDLASWL